MTDRARFSGQVSVGTASTVVRAADVSRNRLILVNDGANAIFVMLSTDGNAPTATLDNGIRLASGSPPLTLEGYTGPVAAIAATAATLMTVVDI